MKKIKNRMVTASTGEIYIVNDEDISRGAFIDRGFEFIESEDIDEFENMDELEVEEVNFFSEEIDEGFYTEEEIEDLKRSDTKILVEDGTLLDIQEFIDDLENVVFIRVCDDEIEIIEVEELECKQECNPLVIDDNGYSKETIISNNGHWIIYKNLDAAINILAFEYEDGRIESNYFEIIGIERILNDYDENPERLENTVYLIEECGVKIIK